MTPSGEAGGALSAKMRPAVPDSPYRAPAERLPEPPDPYLEAWRELRGQRLMAVVLIASTAPVTLLAVYHAQARAASFVVAWWLAGAIAQWRASRFRCPRCTARFAGPERRGQARKWTSACPSCGITIGTPMSPRRGA
jgi:hypothetical protein